MTDLRLRGRSGELRAVVNVPGSKSVANRALMCAALAAPGTSRVTNVPAGDDCVAMLGALREAGCIDRHGDVTGGVFPGSATRFDAGIAGTTSRFLTAAAALGEGWTEIDGGAPLRRRPMGDLHDALRSLGADVRAGAGGAGHLPVEVRRGALHGGKVQVRGDVSSQFVSALMLIGSVLPEGLEIAVTGELVSRPYVEMTAAVMRSFGARVTVGDDRIQVAAGRYVAAAYEVEPDFSSAAFPVMALAFTPGSVTLPGLGRAVLQGDSFVLDVAREMGMSVDSSGPDVTVSRGSGALRPVEVDLRDASDLVPAVAVACTALPGRSVISGVGFIREKESDRLGDLAAELNSGGADVQVADDGLVIRGGGNPETTHTFGTHHDHRLAMAFSLPAAGGHARTIRDHEVVAKSWPGYFGDMSGVLGGSGPLN